MFKNPIFLALGAIPVIIDAVKEKSKKKSVKHG